ncbi:MAG: hypothetical protein IJ168_09560 [Eubacterium sp.]|nr:hypothetical protein [Eubacterium sp.]
MTKLLCVPCSIKLGETKDVKLARHHRDKITCSECGRRRYGNEYEISRKKSNKKRTTKTKTEE